MCAARYHCRPLRKADYQLWNSSVEGAERGTLFHQTHWLEPFRRAFVVIGCYDDAGALVGGMPLAHQRVAWFRIARPPYLTPYLGPVIFRADGKRHRVLTLEKGVALSLINYVTASYDFVRIPLAPNDIDTQPFKQNGFSVDVEYTYVIELDDMDRVWNELDQDKRRKIRKAYREGLLCEPSDDLDRFFPLLICSLAAHDKPLSQSRVREFRDWYRALSAKHRATLLQVKDARSRVCAGAILAWDSKRAYYLLSGMDRGISSGSCMALLLWESMRFCHEELGVKEFDFDGSDIPSVEIFFRGFGGRLTPRFSVVWGRSFVRPVRYIWHSIASITQAVVKALTGMRNG